MITISVPAFNAAYGIWNLEKNPCKECGCLQGSINICAALIYIADVQAPRECGCANVFTVCHHYLDRIHSNRIFSVPRCTRFITLLAHTDTAHCVRMKRFKTVWCSCISELLKGSFRTSLCICTDRSTAGLFARRKKNCCKRSSSFACRCADLIPKTRRVLLKQFPYISTPKRSITEQMILPGAYGSPARGCRCRSASSSSSSSTEIQHSWL